MEDEKLPAPISVDEATIRSMGVAVHNLIEEIGRSSEETERIKAEDREKQRISDRSIHKINTGLSAFFGLVVCGLIAYALHLGKDQMAQWLAQTVLTLVIGGFGGYGIAIRNARKEQAP